MHIFAAVLKKTGMGVPLKTPENLLRGNLQRKQL